MQRRVCRFYNTSKGCRFGANCKFSHGDLGNAQDAPPARQKTTFHVPPTDYDKLVRWLSRFDDHNLYEPSQHSLDEWFTVARELIQGTHLESKQRVVRHLATDNGLQRVINLLSATPAETQVEACLSFISERVRPLLQILAHSDVCRSALLEDAVATIHTTIYGSGGLRGAALFQAASVALGSLKMLSPNHTDLLADIVAALNYIVEHTSTARVNKSLTPVVETLSNLLSVDDLPISASRRKARQAMRHVESMLGLGMSLPEPRSGPADMGVATFELNLEGPGALRTEGPRHDNDSDDIGTLEILPTIEELQSLESEYLPVNDPRRLHLKGLEGAVDRQFRLLREDSIGQLRDAVRIAADQLRTSLGRGSRHNPDSKTGSRVVTYHNVRAERLQLTSNSLALELSFAHPVVIARKSKSERGKWWDNSKNLNKESLVCLIGSDEFAAFLVVVDDPENNKHGSRRQSRFGSLYEDDQRGRIWVQHAEPFQFSLQRSLDCLKASETQHLVLCEFPGILLPSFYHTLQALQMISRKLDTPFAETLAPSSTHASFADLDAPPAYAQLHGFSFDLSSLIHNKDVLSLTVGQPFNFELLSKHSTLDAAQQAAVIHALSRQMALIQGPPGTGKSFCGVALIKALLANKSRANLGPIICVCYTNHALDQLLEHLVDGGVTNIIRLGGRSKSAKLENVNLRQVALGMDSTQTERREQRENHVKLTGLEGVIGSQVSKLHTHISFNAICQYLARHNQRHHRQLQEMTASTVDEDGWQEVDHDKRSPIQRFLYPRAALDRQNAESRSVQDLQDADLVGLSPSERRILLNHWTNAVRKEHGRPLSTMLEDYAAARRALRNCYDERDLRCLHHANIIGLTTSGLARRVDLIRRLPSKVLICEEAGEVLEAHMLTALLPSVEHAILIGDHEQLRPQIQNYELQASNIRGQRFSLDVSLFERLIRPPFSYMPKLPFSTLEIQRRMHPSISDLIRQTLYSKLQDHTSVQAYPSVVGMKKRLFWLDHCMAEKAKDHTASYSNTFEVDFVAALVSHIVKQCQYQPDDIAVLTPYLGQLKALRDRLRNMFEIVIDDRDQAELDKEDLDAQTGVDQQQGLARTTLLSSIRLATVDNFQGEEAKVVIVSLVRSNEKKKCGFLKTTNRTNVLLSRAKHGMYLVGDASCYESQPMWAKVLGLLRENGNVGTALELLCPRHLLDPLPVSTAEDFVRLSPEGGCGRICGDRLGCGHRCPQRCHAQRLHESVFCHVQCNKPREGCDHLCNKACGADCGECEVPITLVQLPCGHVSPVEPCYISQQPHLASCKTLVLQTIPGCGHSVMLPCSIQVNDTTQCSVKCDDLLPCGHQCTKKCSACIRRHGGEIARENHGECLVVCNKDYSLCAHRCASKCHSGDCQPCEAPCQTSCAHSKCAKKCSDPCSPCAEPCTAGCGHSGPCHLPCAAPCDILPCSKRCTKQLDCGHQCISCCGEECPSPAYCQACCSDAVKRQTADWTEMVDFGDVDLDETPCFVLGCGHVLTMSSLDGIMEMSKYYQMADDGTITATKGRLAPFETTMHRCVECRSSIQNLQRYNRIWRRTILDDATKKFIAWSNAEFVPLSQALDAEETALRGSAMPIGPRLAQDPSSSSSETRELRLTGALNDIINAVNGIRELQSRYRSARTLRWKIRDYTKKVSVGEQPFGKVYNLLRASQIANQQTPDAHHQDYPMLQYKQSVQATSLSLRCDIAVLTDFFHQRHQARSPFVDRNNWRAIPTTTNFDEPYRACRDLLTEAAAHSLPMQQVEAITFFGRLVALERASLPSPQRNDDHTGAAAPARLTEARALLDTADALCRAKPGSTRGMPSEVDAVRTMLRDETFYQPISDAEKRAVVAAMSREFGVTGHWYFCPNGHPYTIGNCGQAVQGGVCPECGAGVGGEAYHQLREGNRRAEEIEREFGGVEHGVGRMRL